MKANLNDEFMFDGEEFFETDHEDGFAEFRIVDLACGTVAYDSSEYVCMDCRGDGLRFAGHSYEEDENGETYQVNHSAECDSCMGYGFDPNHIKSIR